MNINEERVHRLIKYVKGIKEKEDGTNLYLEYKDDIEKITPHEAFEIFHSLLKEDTEPKEILVFLDKVINVFYKSLSSYSWTRPENDNFLENLILENKGLTKKTDNIGKILKKEEELNIKKEKLIPKVEELEKFNDHYVKKENILFPYLEKRLERFEGLQIMWALHDEVRSRIKETIRILKDKDTNEKQVNIVIGKLFFGVIGIIKKEELILFPAASEALTHEDWYEMHKQSLEYDFPFIDKKIEDLKDNKEDSNKFIQKYNNGYKFKTETGELDFEQIMMIFNALPVDLTFVDENNKVKYFTRPKDRIFPRSPAIIGREVKNCHPPDSVDVVNRIVDSFKSGEKHTAKFWLKLKGKMILIQYFALRDSEGKYKGTLEVSQDITGIQKLEGQRRILDWD